MLTDKSQIRKTILGNNLLWRCTFTDELVVTPEYDLTYTFGVDARFMSSCQRINISEDNLGKEISQIEHFYKSRNKPPSFYLEPSTNPSTLETVLVERGYYELKAEEEVWWNLDLNNRFPDYNSVNGLIVAECRNRSQFEDHLKAAVEGYKDFKFWASLLSKSYRKPLDGVDVYHYVAYLDNIPVSCSTLGIYFDTAYLINTCVIPNYRRRGIHTAMMLKRIDEAKKLGAKIAFYQTDYDNEASIATGKKVGFQEAFRRRIFTKDL